MTQKYISKFFNSPRKHSLKRCGIYLPDVCVGLVLILTAMVIFSQSLFQLIDHRTDQKLQQIAVDTLLNIQEMIDLETLTGGEREKLQPLENMVARSLPDGQLTVEKLEKPAANNITFYRITVSYDNGKNRPRRELPLIRAINSISSTPINSDSQ
ncbi:MAG: hypothetical protein LBU34_01295 [Planctomycetaceae bacterium]|jgi:hypothetical protein|nr:hypothetical protein [Planctomycetaceae bacterium]